jgi:two-component system cell cycle response regulator
MNANHSIVLIDDNSVSLIATARILKTQGYQLYQAETGLAGVELAREHRPDLVLSDVDLPDIDGIEVCRRIKADPDMAGTYVVLVSHSSTDSDSQSRGMEEGADGYIARPIPNRELLARVQAMLRIQAAESAVRRKARQQSIVAHLGQEGLAGTGIDELMREAVARTAFGLGVDPSLIVFARGGKATPSEASGEAPSEASGEAPSEASGEAPSEAPGEAPRVRLCLEVAIQGQRGQFGLLGVTACPSGEYSAEDADFLSSVGNILSLSVMRKQAEEDIRFLAMHDALTGLHNRAYFEATIGRSGSVLEFPVCLIMVDLDGLKRTNDAFGHEAGDRLLKAASAALRAASRALDLVARIGGDEFVILLPGTDMEKAERLRESIRERLNSGGCDLAEGIPLRLSMGIACADSPEVLDAAIRLADERMYNEKEEHHRIAAGVA